MITTTIPAGTKIYPYATPTGIIQLVPLEALEQAIKERDLARERGFETADVLTATERERDRLKEELASMTRRLQAAEHINEGYRAMEQRLEEAQAAVAELNQRLIERTQDMLSKQTELIQEARQAKREARDAKAELAALRQPILADDGRSLGEVQDDAWQASERNGKTAGECDEAAAQAVAAVVLAQAVRRMEAVPTHELARIWDGYVDTIRARLTAAVQDVEANPVRPNAAECGQCADTATFHLAPEDG